MSSPQDNSTSTNLTKETTWCPKNLVTSRWAPGGHEDKVASPDGSAFGAAAFLAASARMFADPAEIIQTSLDKAEKGGEANKKNDNPNKENDSSTMLRQPRQGAIKHENTLTTKTTLAEKPRRITGPLSEEDQMVKVENPSFDPNKQKSLSNSRWADE